MTLLAQMKARSSVSGLTSRLNMKEISIMIIDDDEVDRYLLKRLIKKSNLPHKIFEAVNGKDARDFLEDYDVQKNKFGEGFPPLLIFLDINMPIMGGFEFLECFSILREKSTAYQTSVFTMFSSSEREEDKAKARSYGFVKGFISKGAVTKEKIKDILSECC